MDPIRQLVLLFALSTVGLVSSFSISKHRSERNTDLAEALAILQRQRRRVGVEDFLNSERLLENRPLTLEDVNDWLSRSDENEVMQNSNWMPQTGNFKDYEPTSGVNSYMSGADMLSPDRIKASENEINDIFADSEEESGENAYQMQSGLEKKKKEEMMNADGDARMKNKQDSSPGNLNNREILNSLTDEEIRVLMKAVGKLQERSAQVTKEKKASEVLDTDEKIGSENSNDVIISEPVTQQEMKSVFTETNGPISKGTVIVESKGPNQETPGVLEQDIVSETLPDDSTIVRERELTNVLPQVIENELEAEQEEEEEEGNDDVDSIDDDAAAEAEAEVDKLEQAAEEAAVEQQQSAEDVVAEELANDFSKDRLSPEIVSKYLLMNRENLYTPQNRQTVKRTAKRASGLYASGLMSDDREAGRGSSRLANLDISNMDTSSLIQAFVVKILALQDEIDGLRFKNRLEDLENDELTDALNEATVGQREGTVSNVEWDSLQHAIEIEQALQDLKKKETGSAQASPISEEEEDDDDDEGTRKRGEPWKRTRDSGGDVDPYAGAIASRKSPIDIDEARNEDIARLLRSTYLMKSDEEDDDSVGDYESFGGNEDEPIASLFMSHADQCPAIQLYSNNCELADLYNLPVDFEARALCNLHEMCYACGHSLSVSQPQCDLVYRAAVSSLCHKKENCVAESEVFLRTMKLKTRYIPHVQPSCRSRCTAQFMGMF